MSADRYAKIQRLPVESHHDALREVMHAGERARLSRGYRPEDDVPAVAVAHVIRNVTIGLAVIAGMLAFGWLTAPMVARVLAMAVQP
jgi:hypothetical protein